MMYFKTDFYKKNTLILCIFILFTACGTIDNLSHGAGMEGFNS